MGTDLGVLKDSLAPSGTPNAPDAVAQERRVVEVNARFGVDLLEELTSRTTTEA